MNKHIKFILYELCLKKEFKKHRKIKINSEIISNTIAQSKILTFMFKILTKLVEFEQKI